MLVLTQVIISQAPTWKKFLKTSALNSRYLYVVSFLANRNCKHFLFFHSWSRCCLWDFFRRKPLRRLLNGTTCLHWVVPWFLSHSHCVDSPSPCLLKWLLLLWIAFLTWTGVTPSFSGKDLRLSKNQGPRSRITGFYLLQSSVYSSVFYWHWNNIWARLYCRYLL